MFRQVSTVWRSSTTIKDKFLFRTDDSSIIIWSQKTKLILQKWLLNTCSNAFPLTNSLLLKGNYPYIIVRPKLVFGEAATRNDYQDRWRLISVTRILFKEGKALISNGLAETNGRTAITYLPNRRASTARHCSCLGLMFPIWRDKWSKSTAISCLSFPWEIEAQSDKK